jgi:hypothetical protein
MDPLAGKDQTIDRTWLAVLITIVSVIPGLILAGVVVVVYTFFLRTLVYDHWIPYLEEITLLWFPEILRGGISSAVAIALAQWCIKNADFRVARYATIAFWGAIFLLIVAFNVRMMGLSLDIIGAIAFLLGFVAGLWADRLA